MSTSCASCGATTSNGLALCDLCQIQAAKCLEFIPVYFGNLARWRPDSVGTRQVPGSREPSTPAERGTDRIGRALEDAGTDLVGWALALAEDRCVRLPDLDSTRDEAGQVSAICRLLAGHLASIGTLEWCGELVRKLAAHEQRLRALTETAVPGWYAGACKRCEAPTYVVPGLTWVTCRGCGVTTYARDHLDVILDEARDWVAQPKRLAEAIVALLDSEQSAQRLHDRIRKWGSLGRLDAVRQFDSDGDPVGPKRYRLSDVLDLVNRPDTLAQVGKIRSA